MTNPDAPLIGLAEQQFGLVARWQATAAGTTRSRWRHLVASGRWDLVTPRVARRPGSPPTIQQRVLAAVLDAGGSPYVAHGAGAALWGAPGFDVEPVELMVVRRSDRATTKLAIVHRPVHLPDPFGTHLDGIPVARPALVLLQLAPRLHPDRLRRLLDHFWSRRLLTGPSVRAELGPLLHRGRAGTVAVRELLDSLPDDYVPPASGLESRFATILERAGLPEMRRQVDLGDEVGWCGRVDFLAHDLPLIVEIDSDRYHAALSDAEADARRQERLEAAGFRVRRFTEHEVWRRADWIVAELRRERSALRGATRAA